VWTNRMFESGNTCRVSVSCRDRIRTVLVKLWFPRRGWLRRPIAATVSATMLTRYAYRLVSKARLWLYREENSGIATVAPTVVKCTVVVVYAIITILSNVYYYFKRFFWIEIKEKTFYLLPPPLRSNL
jgi:hypothetical protein